MIRFVPMIHPMPIIRRSCCNSSVPIEWWEIQVIVLVFLYLVAFIVGIFDAFLSPESKPFDIRFKKMMFTYGIGLIIGKWLSK